MKRCPTCGMLYSDIVTECPTCKVRLDGNPQPSTTPNPAPNPTPISRPVTPPPVQTPPTYNTPAAPAPAATTDKGGFLWYIPGLLIPLVGLIVGLCVKKKKPNCANAAFKGAAIGFAANLILSSITRFL